MKKVEITLPLHLKSESRFSDHWTKRNKRKKQQYSLVRIHWKMCRIPAIISIDKIVLTRISPRVLDDDNLVYAFKFIRDALADLIMPGMQMGRADENLKFEYKQQKNGKINQVIIEMHGDFEDSISNDTAS